MTRGRWSDHFINLSRANPVNLESGPMMGTAEPIICSTLTSSIPTRQMCIAFGVLEDSALTTPRMVPNKAEFKHLFVDMMQDATELLRQINNCGCVTKQEYLINFASRNKGIHYTTAMTGPKSAYLNCTFSLFTCLLMH